MCEIRLKRDPYPKIVFNPQILPLKNKKSKPCDNVKCEEDSCCK